MLFLLQGNFLLQLLSIHPSIYSSTLLPQPLFICPPLHPSLHPSILAVIFINRTPHWFSCLPRGNQNLFFLIWLKPSRLELVCSKLIFKGLGFYFVSESLTADFRIQHNNHRWWVIQISAYLLLFFICLTQTAGKWQQDDSRKMDIAQNYIQHYSCSYSVKKREDIDPYGANCENVLHLYYNLDILSMIHTAKLEFCIFYWLFSPRAKRYRSKQLETVFCA